MATLRRPPPAFGYPVPEDTRYGQFPYTQDPLSHYPPQQYPPYRFSDQYHYINPFRNDDPAPLPTYPVRRGTQRRNRLACIKRWPAGVTHALGRLFPPPCMRRASISAIPSDGVDALFRLDSSVDGSVDVILHSSDGTPFRVHKAWLIAGSDYFRQMFENDPDVLQGRRYGDGGETSRELPVVRLMEDKQTVNALLLCMYLGPEYQPGSLGVLHGTLIAANKYDIPGVKSLLRPYLVSRKFIKANPLLVYSLSRSLGFEEERKRALRWVLGMWEDQLFELDMEEVPAEDLAYVQWRRLDWATFVLTSWRNIIDTDPGRKTPSNFNRPVCMVCQRVPLWVHAWLKSVGARRHETEVIQVSMFA